MGEQIGTGRDGERPGVLLLGGGAPAIPVYYMLKRGADGTVRGYLRLAYGHGNYANRLLNSVGAGGKLAMPDGRTCSVCLADHEPTEAPGYLFEFTLGDGSSSRTGNRGAARRQR